MIKLKYRRNNIGGSLIEYVLGFALIATLLYTFIFDLTDMVDDINPETVQEISDQSTKDIYDEASPDYYFRSTP